MAECFVQTVGVDKSKGLTATPSKIFEGYTALVNGNVITGTAPNVKTGTFTISDQTDSYTVSGLGITPTIVSLVRTSGGTSYLYGAARTPGISFAVSSSGRYVEIVNRITVGNGYFTYDTPGSGDWFLKGTYRWFAL